MSTFRAVNTQLTLVDPQQPTMEDPVPTTPRAFVPDTSSADAPIDELSAKTPTRDSFNGMAAQKPLPTLPAIAPTGPQESSPAEVKSETPNTEQPVKTEDSTQDVEMADSADVKEGSDDSVDGDSGRPSKKKKGQRFFCTEFPPCQLSFTRSEHLARHIRKHTGERPFQCHCNRKFSRLDNLRQHAQTVHVNEDIPMDSLAATGTRFQRQIRTDRVRPANRSRASTFSNPPNPHAHRGHSRNLSSSSVTSISSVSTYGGDDIRRAVHGFETPRTNRLSVDTYVPTSTPTNAQAMQPYYTVGTNSPTGYSTPTSASFSIGNSSPRYSSGLHSPAAAANRSLYWGSKPPSRRLSIPGSNAFQSSQSPDTQNSSYMSPVPSNAAVARTSNYVSTPSGSSIDSRRESLTDQEWRRRTWHPNTDTQLRSRPTSSHVTPQYIADLPRPVFPSQPSQASTTRLPGIHTFDQPPPSLSTLLNNPRPPSPMQLDPAPTSHPTEAQPPSATETANNRISWTSSLQTGINRLEITNNQKPQEISTWNPANPNARATESQTAQSQGHVRQHSDDPPITPRKNKRMGWYMQPPAQPTPQNAQRPSPDSMSSDGAPTPVATIAEYHPAIVQTNGHVESHAPSHLHGIEEQPKPAPPPVYQPVQHIPQPTLPMQSQNQPFAHQKAWAPPVYSPAAEKGDLRRLEALVAVATSEEQRI